MVDNFSPRMARTITTFMLRQFGHFGKITDKKEVKRDHTAIAKGSTYLANRARLDLDSSI